MSSVVVPEVVDYTDAAGAAFVRFADAGAHVVALHGANATWPGLIGAALAR